MLRSLPQSIGNVRNLNILDLSYNKLLYLPITMLLLKELEYLDITMNLFRIQEYEENNEQCNKQNNEQNNVRVQSLVILSANIVLQHRFVVFFQIVSLSLSHHTHTYARARAHAHTQRTRTNTKCLFLSILLRNFLFK